MIGIQKELIQFIPSLVITKTSKLNEPAPLIIYFHGFTSAKEHNLPIAYLLAEQGYRVVLPDSKYHGEREKEITKTERYMYFWDIVMDNVHELEIIRDYYDQKGLILKDQIGIAGTSMGGITTAAALTHYSWIKVAAILMGTPKITTYAKSLVNNFKMTGDLPITKDMVKDLYDNLAPFDLSKQSHYLNNRPLLFWHGENDAVVPFDHSFTFYDEVKESYNDKDRIHFVSEENIGHKVTRYAILETVKWFTKFL